MSSVCQTSVGVRSGGSVTLFLNPGRGSEAGRPCESKPSSRGMTQRRQASHGVLLKQSILSLKQFKFAFEAVIFYWKKGPQLAPTLAYTLCCTLQHTNTHENNCFAIMPYSCAYVHHHVCTFVRLSYVCHHAVLVCVRVCVFLCASDESVHVLCA